MTPRAPAHRATRDALLAVLVVLSGGVLFTGLDAAESLSALLSRGEAFEVDDVLLTMVLAVASATWLAIRRYADARRQATALGESERERLRSIERLGALSAKLMSAESDERERIAVVLHDAVSQPLYAARLRLDAWLDRNPEHPQRELVREAHELVEAAMAQGRDLTSELSPPGLSDLPIVDALEALAAQLSGRYHVAMRVERAGPWDHIEPPLRRPVYEAVRELLSNAGKHARATTVVVSALDGQAQRPSVRVQDDGVGFDPSAGQHTGFGLLSIEQRLHRAGLALSIESAPGRGTTALVRDVQTARSLA